MTWLLGNVPKGNLLLTLLKTPAWLEGHWSRHTPLSSWGRSLTFLMQTNWFMRRLECLKKLRNVISGTLRAATSLADMSSGYEATNLCVQKNLLSAREKWTPGNVQCSRTCQLCFALLFFLRHQPAEWLTHSGMGQELESVTCKPTSLSSPLVASASSTQGLWVAVVSEVVWLTLHHHLGQTHNVTLRDTPPFFYLIPTHWRKLLVQTTSCF